MTPSLRSPQAKQQPISLVLPEPPSANRYWRHVNGRTVLSAAAKNYRFDVQIAVAQQLIVWRNLTGSLSVTVRWFRSRKAGDLDNRLKQLLDALRERVYADDSQVVELHAYRADDKENPRCEVLITSLPQES